MFFDMFKDLFPPGTEPVAFPLFRKIAGKASGILTTLRGTSPLSLVNAVKGKLKKLVQFGKVSVSDGVITCNNGTLSVTDGEIVTTGTAEEVTVTGVNILDLTKQITVLAGSIPSAVTITSGDGTATITEAYYSRTSNKFGWAFSVEPNTSYTCSFKEATNQYCVLRIYTANGEMLVEEMMRSIPIVYSFNSGENSVLYFYVTVNSWGQTLNLSEVQINLGTTALPYVPYAPPQTVSDIPNLYAVDNIADEYDLVSGKITHRTEAIVQNGEIVINVLAEAVEEQGAAHSISLSAGTNTVSWTAEVSGKEMEATYKADVASDNALIGFAIIGKAKI